MTAVRRRCDRSGTVLVLTLLMMVAMLIVVAMAVDLGYLQMAATQMQRSADAAAVAAAWNLLTAGIPGHTIDQNALSGVRSTAGQFAGLNRIIQNSPQLAVQDALIGYLAYPFNQSALATDTGYMSRFNAVTVHVRRTAEQNGEVGLFFSKIMGTNSCPMEADATAAFCNNFNGFRFPSSGQNLGFLPFTVDKPTWDSCVAGTGNDDYKWDPDTKQIVAGSDGIKELNLYPQGTGLPGNRGTVNIGASNNSTAHISSQIRYGLSQADLAFHGGQLALDASGHLNLTGDPGISAAVKDDLTSVIGEPRILPIYDQATGNGNNASYRIVGFVGARILEVKLTGSMSQKRVTIQPACVVTPGAIPSTNGALSSTFIYSPAILVK